MAKVSVAEYPLLINIWTGTGRYQNLIKKKEKERKKKGLLREHPEYSLVQPCWKKNFLLNFQSYTQCKKSLSFSKWGEALPFKWEKFTEIFRTEILATVEV